MSTIFPEYESKTANQHKQAFEVKKILPPNCEWFTLDNFDLSKIPKKFVPATFQRKHSVAHVNRIVESIINNTFYDNTIRCVKLKNGQYEVIDGQHRLKALWILHKQYGIKHYNLVMQYFKSTEAREVFRKINSGRRLTTMDYLKTLDDGTFTFFDDLREYATHKQSKVFVSFLKLLNAVSYLHTGVPRSLSTHSLEDVIESIEPDELTHMYRISKVIFEVKSKLKSDRVFLTSLILPLYKIGLNNNYSERDYFLHFKDIIVSEIISDFLKERFNLIHKKLFEEIDKNTRRDK